MSGEKKMARSYHSSLTVQDAFLLTLHSKQTRIRGKLLGRLTMMTTIVATVKKKSKHDNNSEGGGGGEHKSETKH